MIRYYARKLHKYMPHLKEDLIRASLTVSPLQYIQTSLRNGVGIGILVTLVVFILYRGSQYGILLGVFGGVLTSIGASTLLLHQKNVLIQRRAYEEERMMIRYVEQMLIQMHSGRTVAASLKRMGRLVERQDAFGKNIQYVIARIHAGESLEFALQHVAKQCASLYVQKFFLDLKDASISGADLHVFFDRYREELYIQRKIQLTNFASSMSPLIMIYLVAGVVFPALAIMLFILLGFFIGLGVVMLQVSMVGLLLVVVIVQYTAFTAFKHKKKLSGV